ncbi:MAG TPA: helix-turn-helix domain-containing protein [Paucimonas sp.]|nr:helix-turn-helix domain-containing protein [Paucimonas sp.]
MSDTTSPRSPETRIWPPHSPWHDQVRAYIVRDTRGCGLAGHQQLNRFPASSHCAITWFLEGSVEVLSYGGVEQRTPLASCIVNGCQTLPITSRNCGDVNAFMVVFYPDAFHALFGIYLAPLQNRIFDAREVLPPHGLELIETVRRAPSHEERQHVIERFLAQHAPAIAPTVWTRLRRLGNRITLSFASAMLGVGPRQLQRIALREAGVNLQSLIRLWRGERSFIKAQREYLQGKPIALADHALAVGYADQAHLARDCKAQTGRSPTQLARDVQTEEADWIYRLPFPTHEDPPPSRSP